MKKIKVLLVIGIIAVFAAVSCSKGGGNPEATMDKIMINLLSVLNFHQGNPEATMDKIIKAAKAKDWGGVYDCFSKESTAKLETMMKGFIQLAAQMAKMSPEAAKDPKMGKILELENATGKDFFVKFFSTDADSSNKMIGEFENYSVLKKEINGDKAKLTIKTAQKEDEVEFVKEDGMWKMDLTGKLNQALQQGK